MSRERNRSKTAHHDPGSVLPSKFSMKSYFKQKNLRLQLPSKLLVKAVLREGDISVMSVTAHMDLLTDPLTGMLEIFCFLAKLNKNVHQSDTANFSASMLWLSRENQQSSALISLSKKGAHR